MVVEFKRVHSGNIDGFARSPVMIHSPDGDPPITWSLHSVLGRTSGS
jgi:hypothetical protein